MTAPNTSLKICPHCGTKHEFTRKNCPECAARKRKTRLERYAAAIAITPGPRAWSQDPMLRLYSFVVKGGKISKS
jgi:predicted amidophosphoribosyltransferase